MPPARPHDASNIYPFGPDVPGRPYIAARAMARATRDEGMLEACDLYDSFAETLQLEPEPSTFDKVVSAFNNDRVFFYLLGVYSGALFTAVMAYAWARAGL